MPYRAPINDYRFLFDHVVDLAQVAATDRFAEATDDLTTAILFQGTPCAAAGFDIRRSRRARAARILADGPGALNERARPFRAQRSRMTPCRFWLRRHFWAAGRTFFDPNC